MPPLPLDSDRSAGVLLDALFEQTPMGIAFFDSALRFLRVNDVLARINGVPVADHIGRTVGEVVPALEPIAQQIVAELERTRAPLTKELEGETPAQPGVTRAWQEHWFPLLEGGAITGYGVLIEEITARRQAEAERARTISALQLSQAQLRASEERLRLSMEAAYLIGFSWDIAKDEVHRLHSISDALPATPPQAPVRFADVRARVHPDDRDLFEQRVQRALDDPQGRYESEFRVVEDDGRICWLYERGVVSRGADGRPEALSGLSQDITARKNAEEALHQANQRKDEFLATLAHELRNPLAPIRSATEVLRLLGLEHPTMQKAVDIIDRQVTNMVRLVDDLLDVNRITRGDITLHREVTDIARIVHAAVETSRPLLDVGRHTFTLTLPEGTLRVDADPARLAQALSNLLNNAARYTPPGGQITLAVQAEDGRVVVRVQDTGCGIAPERLTDVFEMFTRAAPKGAQGGLGIGLAIVRRLVQMHGGDVRALSAGEGQGATFELWLPAVPDAAPPPPVVPSVAAEPTEGSLRILIVDDNEDFAVSEATMLELRHHVVCVVHDAAAALDVVPVFSPDVALLDIGLPGMDGYELAARLRTDPALEGIVLVAQTGWGQRTDRERAAAAGFDAHLTKPVDWAALQRVLARARRRTGR